MTTGARPKDVGLAALHPIDPRPKLLVAAGRDGPPVRFPHFRVEAVLAVLVTAEPARVVMLRSVSSRLFRSNVPDIALTSYLTWSAARSRTVLQLSRVAAKAAGLGG